MWRRLLIYKISETVFSNGKINYCEKYLKNICSLIDKGVKFVPMLIDNKHYLFNNLYSSIDNSLVKLNVYILNEKNKQMPN